MTCRSCTLNSLEGDRLLIYSLLEDSLDVAYAGLRTRLKQRTRQAGNLTGWRTSVALIMQDRFIGDIGDFEKYGLLRALAGVHPPEAPELSLGVVWYKVPDLNIDFLKDPTGYRDCDPLLFNELNRVVQSNERTIAAIQHVPIWPKGTKFFGEPAVKRKPSRPDDPWLDAAVEEIGKCELVFLDPDNGLENRSKDRCSREHCSYNDVQRLWERGASLVIYQHQHRFKRQAEQMAAIADELKEVVGTRPWYLHFTQRSLFVVPSKRHDDILKARFLRFVGNWGGHPRLGNGPE